jgi:hypothetical protein
MNKTIKLLLSAVLLVSAQAFAASTPVAGEYNRTASLFANVNVTAENCWARLHNTEKSDDAVGLCIGALGWWHQIPSGTRSGLELARGFSPAGLNPFTLTSDLFTIPSGGTPAQNTTTVEFTKVEHRRVGAGAGLCYNLDNLYDGLWVAANGAVLYERNCFTFNSNDGVGTGTGALMATYLRGGAVDTTKQAVLSNLRLESGRAMSNTGFNHVNLVAGLRVINSDNAMVAVKVVGTIPTGNKMDNTSLFQPNAGVRNGKIGAAACALVKLINDDDYAINFSGDIEWQYGIKRNDLVVPQHGTVGWAHYRLVARVGDTIATPLANVLAGVTADVESKNEFNALAKVSFEKGYFGVDLGYNFYYTQEKTLTFKNFPTAPWYFVNSAWAYATASAPTTFVQSTHADGAVIGSADFLSTSPSQSMHKIFAGANVLFSEWEFPLLVGVTGSYSFAQKRTVTPEYFGVSLRAGVSF